MDEIQLQKKIGNAIKWLEALVSGQYKQGYRVLGNKEKGFCCWGLGCHIVGKKFSANSGWDNELMHKIGFKANGSLQEIVKTEGGHHYVDLWSLNDAAKWSFEQIGKYLIEHPNNFEREVELAIREHFKNYIYPTTRSIQQALKDAELRN